MKTNANCQRGNPKAARWAGFEEQHPDFGHPDVCEVTILLNNCLGGFNFRRGARLQAGSPSGNEVENFGANKIVGLHKQ